MASSTTGFWAKLDQEALSAALQTKLEKELSEGFSSLKDHLQPRDKVKQNLDSLERKASGALRLQLEILRDMCRDIVFVEPAEAPRRLPAGFKKTEEELDREIDEAIVRLSKVKGELQSVEKRLEVLNAGATVANLNLKRVRPVADYLDVDGLKEITKGSKRLRHLVQCTREFRQKLPSIDDTSVAIEQLIAKEKRGMASTRELQALDKLLTKSA